jgi:NADH dehydrogenase FAD-containing subunit
VQDKEITIVQGDKRLLNKTYPDKFRLDMERRVRANKVHLILDDYIDSLTASTTRKGVQLDADLIVSARGPRPNTSFIASSLGKEVVNDEGFVHIRPTMQLAEYPSIFAMGDIIEFPEQKQVGKYGGHASVVAPNVLSLLSGAPPKKEYKGTVEAIFDTIGKVRVPFVSLPRWSY